MFARSHILFCALYMLCCNTNSAQNIQYACDAVNVDYTKFYYLAISYNFKLIPDNYSEGIDSVYIPAYKKFKVFNPDGEKYVVKFADTLQHYSFTIDKNIFDCNAIVTNARYFSFSLITLPIKIRAFPKYYFDWEVNKNLGAGFGYYGPWNRSPNISLGILFNAGASSVLIDSFSTYGLTNDFLTVDVLSLAVGTCFIFGRNFQIGVVGGFDFMSSRFHDLFWVYNKYPWFGFGVGYTFITILDQGF
ncbi:MAG: hypothetical protein ACKVPJ_08285 [Chitinophagales bacterium]